MLETPGPLRLEGADAATEYVMVWLRAFPDARQTIHSELVAGDWVVQECVVHGHAHGDADVAGRGHPADEPAGDRPRRQIARIEGGKISRSTCTSTRWSCSPSSG